MRAVCVCVCVRADTYFKCSQTGTLMQQSHALQQSLKLLDH